jgi:hypothetical protein
MLDAGGGGGMPLMSGLLAAANDGSFAVNDTGGQALLTAIREMARWVDDNIGDLRLLAQQQPLGTSNGAEVIKPYLQEVATDQEGFLTMLQEFRASLTDAEAGVIGAMNNYRNIDHDVERTYRA